MVEKQMQEQFAKMIELIKHLLPCSEVTWWLYLLCS
jgi:hypothetical protein